MAAVVLGGTSLSGGKGSLIGTLLGVFILRTLDNGLILVNLSGRGDKDVDTAARWFGLISGEEPAQAEATTSEPVAGSAPVAE